MVLYQLSSRRENFRVCGKGKIAAYLRFLLVEKKRRKDTCDVDIRSETG
jgi:hypothetical protein